MWSLDWQAGGSRRRWRKPLEAILAALIEVSGLVKRNIEPLDTEAQLPATAVAELRLCGIALEISRVVLPYDLVVV